MRPSEAEIKYCLKRFNQGIKLTKSESEILANAARQYLAQQETIGRVSEWLSMAIEINGGWQATVKRIARVLDV